MFQFRMKDVALVAVATGLLAFEAIALQETVPAVKRSLVRLAGLNAARLAERIASPAGAIAGASMVDGAGRVALATVSAAKATAIRLGEPAAAASPKGCMMMVVDGAGTAGPARVRVVTVSHQGCRERARATADRRNVQAIRRALAEHKRAETIQRTIESTVETTVETSSS
jgi:hypothetical protein